MSVPPRGISAEVLEENLPAGLVLVADKPQPQEETTECVLLVLVGFGLCRDPFLIPRHLAQLADEVLTSLGGFRRDFAVQPIEGRNSV